MNNWFKKIFIFSVLIFIVGIYTTPLAFAQTSYCWPKTECEKAGGIWAGEKPNLDKEGEKKCSQTSTEYNYCYPNNSKNKVDLQIPIGSLKKAGSLLEYIPNIYNYLISIVSIVAVIMIMVGGLQYLTAGGSSEKIGKAKNTILGSIIGLFLAFGANLILQTINPALVQLTLPQLKMIAPQSISPWCPNTDTYKDKFKCGNKYTKKTNPELPISSEFCFGSVCKDTKKSCVKTSKNPICMYPVIKKICENIKTIASNCSSTVFPAWGSTCHKSSFLMVPINFKNDGIEIPSNDILKLIDTMGSRIYKIIEEPNVTLMETNNNTNRITINSEYITLTKDGIQISLCKNDTIGCGGQNNQTLDDICKQLNKLPINSTLTQAMENYSQAMVDAFKAVNNK